MKVTKMNRKNQETIMNPRCGIVFVPLIFAFSFLVIIGYYWIFRGYAGNLVLTISRYVGLEIWTSILFFIFNIFIIILMLRFYLFSWRNYSKFWLFCALVQALGFIILSIFPHQSFLSGEIGDIVSGIHIFMARMMFMAMFLMGAEQLRLIVSKKMKPPKILLVFLLCGVFCFFGFSFQWKFVEDTILVWESLYIFLFMGSLVFSSNQK